MTAQPDKDRLIPSSVFQSQEEDLETTIQVLKNLEKELDEPSWAKETLKAAQEIVQEKKGDL